MNNQITSPSTKSKRSPKRLVLIILGCLVGALVLLDLSPVGGNYRMYTAWARCGQKPIAATSLMNDHFYSDPSLYEPVDIFPPEAYYCTVQEAEEAGYRPSLEYEFQHQNSQ